MMWLTHATLGIRAYRSSPNVQMGLVDAVKGIFGSNKQVRGRRSNQRE